MKHVAIMLREDMARVTRERKNLLDLAASGKITEQDFDARIADLLQRAQNIEKALAVLRELESWKEDEEDANAQSEG